MKLTPLEIAAAVPITCDCGREFRISAIGVGPTTNIVCPSCGKVDQLDRESINRIDRQWEVAIATATSDEIELALWNARLADEIDTAVVVPAAT